MLCDDYRFGQGALPPLIDQVDKDGDGFSDLLEAAKNGNFGIFKK